MIPARALAKFYTLWSRMCCVPQYIVDSRTILLPKGPDIKRPSEFKPISISPVFLRQHHRILNKRLRDIVSISSQQYGFEPRDGIAQAIDKIDTVFAHFKSRFNAFAADFNDLRKAFDSFAFSAIYNAFELIGLLECFNDYIKFIYTSDRIDLIFKRETSSPIKPTRGVRQDDTLSSTIFLLVLDLLLRVLPNRIGAFWGSLLELRTLLTRTTFWCLEEMLALCRNFYSSSVSYLQRLDCQSALKNPSLLPGSVISTQRKFL